MATIKSLLCSPDDQSFELGLALLQSKAKWRDTSDILKIVRRLTKDTKYWFFVHADTRDIIREVDVFFQHKFHKASTPLMNMLNIKSNDNIKVDADKWRWSVTGSSNKNNSESL